MSGVHKVNGHDDATRFVIPSRKICVFVPSYTGRRSNATDNSLSNASAAAHQKGWTIDLITREGDSCIQRARCWAITKFLEQTDATDIFMLDDDIGFSPEGFVRLMEFPVDVVGGAYRARGPEEHYILRPLDNELQRKPPHGLMEVAGLGTGFLRITRKAARKIVAAMADNAVKAEQRAAELVAWLDGQNASAGVVSDLKRIVLADAARAQQHWYTDPTCPNMHVRNLFEFSVTENQLNSEDYNFCQLWRSTGGQVWVDPEQVLDHIGFATYRGCLLAWLEKQMPKIPDQVPQGEAAAYIEQMRARQALPATLLDSAKQLLAEVNTAA